MTLHGSDNPQPHALAVKPSGRAEASCHVHCPFVEDGATCIDMQIIFATRISCHTIARPQSCPAQVPKRELKLCIQLVRLEGQNTDSQIETGLLPLANSGGANFSCEFNCPKVEACSNPNFLLQSASCKPVFCTDCACSKAPRCGVYTASLEGSRRQKASQPHLRTEGIRSTARVGHKVAPPHLWFVRCPESVKGHPYSGWDKTQPKRAFTH